MDFARRRSLRQADRIRIGEIWAGDRRLKRSFDCAPSALRSGRRDVNISSVTERAQRSRRTSARLCRRCAGQDLRLRRRCLARAGHRAGKGSLLWIEGGFGSDQRLPALDPAQRFLVGQRLATRRRPRAARRASSRRTARTPVDLLAAAAERVLVGHVARARSRRSDGPTGRAARAPASRPAAGCWSGCRPSRGWRRPPAARRAPARSAGGRRLVGDVDRVAGRASTGFSASATIWALPESVPTRIRILAMLRTYESAVRPATRPDGAAVRG